MSAYDILYRLGAKLGLFERFDARPFVMESEERGKLGSQADGDFAKLFFSHRGRSAHKWVHYLPLYERHFGPYRAGAVRMLEIGVDRGGSLELWRKFFGPEAVLYGIDIDPTCADRVSPPNEVRIGSQADASFLRSVVSEMGGLDLVLDDGSHIGRHQWASFRVLFPLLREGGLYAIEDLHTSYWPGVLEGGYGRKGTGIDLVKTLLDDMHARFHRRGVKVAGEVSAVYVYDSVAFVQKGRPVTTGMTRMPADS